MSGLLNNPNNELFGHSFLVSHSGTLIGYLNIGHYNKEEKCVYLRTAIDKNQRGQGYGKLLLSEITEYIFQNYSEVLNIRLKIAKDNIPSLMTANACGYTWLRDDFYNKVNPYINVNKIR